MYQSAKQCHAHNRTDTRTGASMGLEDFSSDDTEQTNQTVRQSTSEERETEEKEDGYFKVVGSGNNKKVFQTEEDWLETKEFIKEEMNKSVNEVLNMSAEKRYDILHRAILGRMGLEPSSFHPTRQCIVCGYTFTYPSNWNFEEFNGEPACKHHTIEEVKQAYEKVNSIQG